MTQTHQTQCPNCQHSFSVTDEQLALKSGFARCNNCHKIFSAIDHLSPNAVNTEQVATNNKSLNQSIVATDQNSPNSIRPVSSSPSTASNTKPAAVVIDDLLFDDHSGLDEDGSLIQQPKTQVYSVNSANRQPTKSTLNKTSAQDFDIIDNFDSLPAPSTVGFQAAPSDHEDEAWLTKLLDEDKSNVAPLPLEGKLTQRNLSENDVTSLLDELGVDVSEEQGPSDDEYLKRVNERFQKQTATHKYVKTTSPAMTAFWAIGSLLLAGLLAAQYVIFNADNMIKDPNRAGTLRGICQSLPFDCNLPIADTSLIDVNTLSLEPAKTDAKKTDMIIALKNKSSTPNLYPNLKVTLRSGNQTKAQFIVPAHQYIEQNNDRLVGEQIKPLKFRIDYPRQQFEQANVDLYY